MAEETNSGLKLFCTDISLKIGEKENFRITRRTFDCIVRVVGPDLAKKDTRLRKCILDK